MVSRILGDEHLTLVDIGSAGGVQPRWRPIAARTRYVGFEPDARSHAEMVGDSSGHFASYALIPAAVWSEDGELLIHLCRKPRCSSHFHPSVEFVRRFPGAHRMDVVGKVAVAAKRLDSVGIERADFIKMDIQGGELAALQGGELLLSTTLGMEIEAEFSPIYDGQPLFGALAAFVAQRGFEFIDFTRFGRWERDARSDLGQCVFTDALFLRTPEYVRARFNEGALGVQDLRRYLAILALYRRADLMAACRDAFTDVLRAQPELARALGSAIAALRRQLRLARIVARTAGFFLRLLGSTIRVHVHY
jgi:FkbM family methyltransferase